MGRDRANEQLDRVLNATTDSVMSVGRDWRILYMNQQGIDNLAVKGDIVGENLWEVFSDAVFEGSPHIKYHYRAMTERLPGEFEDYKGPPLNAWYNVRVRPSREGIIIFFRDVTQEKRAEAALIEPFFTTKGIGGVGLGLWIADDTVRRHEGRVQLRSSQSIAHRGTTVTVFLPHRNAANDRRALSSAL